MCPSCVHIHTFELIHDSSPQNCSLNVLSLPRSLDVKHSVSTFCCFAAFRIQPRWKTIFFKMSSRPLEQTDCRQYVPRRLEVLGKSISQPFPQPCPSTWRMLTADGESCFEPKTYPFMCMDTKQCISAPHTAFDLIAFLQVKWCQQFGFP